MGRYIPSSSSSFSLSFFCAPSLSAAAAKSLRTGQAGLDKASWESEAASLSVAVSDCIENMGLLVTLQTLAYPVLLCGFWNGGIHAGRSLCCACLLSVSADALCYGRTYDPRCAAKGFGTQVNLVVFALAVYSDSTLRGGAGSYDKPFLPLSCLSFVCVGFEI